MILPLRQRHRRMFTALGLLFPVVFVIGIAARRPIPVMAALPDGLGQTAQKFPIVKWVARDFFGRMPIEGKLLREHTDSGGLAVQLSTTTDFTLPDALVYWIPGHAKELPGNASTNDVLPTNAVFLGVFDSPVTLPLPANAVASEGSFMLYSLANQKVAGVSSSFIAEKP